MAPDPDRITELTRAVTALGDDVKGLGGRQDTVRRVVAAMFAFGYIIAVVAVGSLVGWRSSCQNANGTRSALRSIFELALAQSPPQRQADAAQFFDRAVHLIRPIDCGIGATTSQVGHGFAIALLASLVLGAVTLLALPCWRKRFFRLIRSK